MSLEMHIISGYVGSDPETREVNGREEPQQVTSFSVAVNDTRRKDSPPTWYRVTAWNGLGNVVGQYVRKGDYVVVTADRQRVSTWVDRDGETRVTLDLTASAVDFSANRRGETEADSEPKEEIPF